MSKRKRVDANQKEIVAALRESGASVIVCSHIGDGFPDLLVGYNGQTFLVEVKNPNTAYGKKGLNYDQAKFASGWGGTVHIVRNAEEAMSVIGCVRRQNEVIRAKKGKAKGSS